MSSNEDDGSALVEEQEGKIKHAKSKRAVAKSRFTRKVKMLREAITDDADVAILKDLETEVCEALSVVEKYNDMYMLLLTNQGDRENDLEEVEEYMEALDGQKVNIMRAMYKQIKNNAVGDKTIKMIALQPPQ